MPPVLPPRPGHCSCPCPTLPCPLGFIKTKPISLFLFINIVLLDSCFVLFWWLLVWVLFPPPRPPPQPLLFCPPAFCSAARSQRDEGTLSPSLFADGLSPGCRELLRPEPGPGLPLPPLSSGRRGLPAGARCSLGLPFPAGALGGAGGESGAGLTAGAGPALAAACRPRQRGCLCVGPAPWAVAGAAGASSPVEGHGGSGPTTGGGGGGSSLPARPHPCALQAIPRRTGEEGEAPRPEPRRCRSPLAVDAAATPSPFPGLQLPARTAPQDYSSRQAPRGTGLPALLHPPPAEGRRRRRAPPPRAGACAAAAGRGRGMRGGGSAVIGGARREGGAAAAILGAGQ